MQEPVASAHSVSPPGANGSLWVHEPQMATLPGDQYYGRVFFDVYDSGVHFAICGDPALLSRVRSVLQGAFTPLRGSQLPWTNAPVGALQQGQQFLGRVIVECWRDRAVVGVSGDEAQVVARALQRLDQC